MEETKRIRGWMEAREAGMLKEPLDERIDRLTLIKPFPINEMSLYSIKRLIMFSEMNTNGHWGQAVDMLLDIADEYGRQSYIDMSDTIAELQTRVKQLEEKALEPKKERKVPRGFGEPEVENNG